jgi:diaminopimelate decarboxylase
MFTQEQVKTFGNFHTPFYYYDVQLLNVTLKNVKNEASKYGYHVHYALKANANPKILKIINSYGIGADCVSGNEVTRAVETGFPAQNVVFAGVGKSDREITTALNNNIFCFNIESEQEIEVLNEIAGNLGKKANIAMRINPNVEAHTHHYITTGIEENKFGINLNEMLAVIAKAQSLKNVELIGIHFHIGSQITNLDAFKLLCERTNEIQDLFEKNGIFLEHINVGGGLGVNYEDITDVMPDFKTYFSIFNDNLKLRQGQKLHFELGRSLVAKCGYLISRVLYTKPSAKTTFAIIDAGMTELIRPALYQAVHKIVNISSSQAQDTYDVVGPICESSDTFAKGIQLPATKRGDLLAITTAGAYGQVMSSQYNLRDLAKEYYSDEI